LLASLSLFRSRADHRALHSFPTRRSSDLGGEIVTGDDDRRAIALCDELQARRAQIRQAAPQHVAAVERLFDIGPDHLVRDAPGEDRKSTRLNSSHVKISYAVFCLKKKKQK